MVTDLKEFAKTAKPSVAVVGLGGAGCNITTWIAEKGITGGRIIAANTDVNHLYVQKADKVILLGEKLCKGHGCGGYPEMGAQATRENISELKAELEGTNLVFLVAGLGGGTGTGAIPVVAELTRSVNALTIGCVTIPFTIEMSRREKAREAIKLLAESCDSVVIIDNSKLREVAGNLPLKEALNVANALVGAFVKNLTDTITQPSLVNLDYADLRAVMERGGISSIGIGEGDGVDRVIKAVSQAISTPLLDVTNISDCYGVLIHIVGGEDLTLEEVAVTGELIMDKVPNTKRIIWGAKVDNSLTGKVRVMAVLTGVQSPFISGSVEKVKEPEPEPVREPETKPEPPKPKPAPRIEAPRPQPKVEEEKSSSNYVWYAIILLIILILIWYWLQ
ncbi:MAG: cell division protein FtsZ [Candidatus Methanoperedens sp.]